MFLTFFDISNPLKNATSQQSLSGGIADIEKVKEYLDKLFVPTPDSITKAIDGIIEKAKRKRVQCRHRS
jgi:hypothetical protein